MVFGTILEGMKFVREIEKQNGTPPKDDGRLESPSLRSFLAAKECKIEDSGEIPLEKPYKDPVDSFSITFECRFSLM